MFPSIDEGPRLIPADPAAGPAPVVVLLHGQPGTAADWYRVVPLLSTDHRVIAVDRPGYFGEPSQARDWSGNAEALFAMLDQLGIDEVFLVAASWSGGVAIEAARQAPDRISGIVFVAAVGGKGAITWIDQVIAWAPIRRIGARLAPHTGVSLARPFWWALGSRLDEEANREARLSLAVWRSRRVWTAAAIEQRYLVRDHEQLIKHVSDLDLPSIVLQGTHDYTVPLEAGVKLAESLPHAELIKPDAGHMLAFEEPLAVAAAVRQLTGRTH
jgi:pimeloyl-ACP methyl ester carboxylesterase